MTRQTIYYINFIILFILLTSVFIDLFTLYKCYFKMFHSLSGCDLSIKRIKKAIDGVEGVKSDGWVSKKDSKDTKIDCILNREM